MEPINSSHIAIEALFESTRTNSVLDSDSRSHLDSCDLCRSRQSWMQTAGSMGASELKYEPPRELLENVFKLSRRPGLIKQLRNFIVASMTFDSFTSPAPVNVRHTQSSSRQMTYVADDVEIAISVQPSQAHTLTLTGQVLRKDGTAIGDTTASVDLVVEGDHMKALSLSPWGEFVFPDLPHAAYALQFSLADRVVRIPALPE
jgi:hypothetical protein